MFKRLPIRVVTNEILPRIVFDEYYIKDKRKIKNEYGNFHISRIKDFWGYFKRDTTRSPFQIIYHLIEYNAFYDHGTCMASLNGLGSVHTERIYDDWYP